MAKSTTEAEYIAAAMLDLMESGFGILCLNYPSVA